MAFSINGTTKRILVARGTADGGNPAEVAYSDNAGATWTTVNVGSVNGQYVTRAQGMFALDQYNVWLVTNDGYIYKSEDGGVTWTAQEVGTLAATGWNAIVMLDALNGWVAGASNKIATTEDGGMTWTLVSGASAQAAVNCYCLAVVNEYEIWIGYSDGDLYYTMDGGVTWTKRALPVTAAAVNAVSFANQLVGYVVYDTAAPVGGLLRTIDGGYTWEAVALPTNAGLNAIQVIGAERCLCRRQRAGQHSRGSQDLRLMKDDRCPCARRLYAEYIDLKRAEYRKESAYERARTAHVPDD